MIRIESLKLFNQKYLKAEKWYPFAIILGINLVLLLTYPQKSLYGDAEAYVNLSKMFTVDGHFSLLNYYNLLRGYFFPLLLQIPLQFSNLTGLNELFCFRVLSAISSAFCFAVLFPQFFEELFNFHAKPAQILIFAGLITFFWYGYFAYPLSDFPALTFLLTGLVLCLHAFKSKRAFWFKGLLFFGGGICLAATPLIRTVYLIPFFLLVLILVIRLAFSKFTVSVKVTLAALLIMGSILSFVPQALSNKIHYQTSSPFPQNKVTDTTDLFLGQLYMGMRQQRNDFGAKMEDGNVTPMLGLPDYQGIGIMKKQNVGELDESWTLKRYFSLVYHQPFDMAALYVRHLFNGLDIVYPTGYVPNIFGNQIIYRFVNYTLWFLAIVMVWRRGISIKKDAEKLVIPLIVALTALLSIPGMMEVRFFLPIYVLMYGCISFWFLSKRIYWKQLFTLRSAISYICFMAACFTFSSYLFATSHAGLLLQN